MAVKSSHFPMLHIQRGLGRSSVDKLGSLEEVEDPLMQCLSKLRRRCCGLAPVDRCPGDFEKSKEDATEPARTERLLGAPFALFHRRSGDSFDGQLPGLKLLGHGSSGPAGRSLVNWWIRPCLCSNLVVLGVALDGRWATDVHV